MIAYKRPALTLVMSLLESREKRVESICGEPSCISDRYYSIQFAIFLPSAAPPFSRVSHFGGSFHPGIENYAHTIYLLERLVTSRKEMTAWERCNSKSHRKEQCIILFDGLPVANWIWIGIFLNHHEAARLIYRDQEALQYVCVVFVFVFLQTERLKTVHVPLQILL